MKSDLIICFVLFLLSILDALLLVEGRVFCFRRVKRRGKCGGFLRKARYARPEDCCAGRGQGFATTKVRYGRNRFRCSPCKKTSSNSNRSNKWSRRRLSPKIPTTSRSYYETTTTTVSTTFPGSSPTTPITSTTTTASLSLNTDSSLTRPHKKSGVYDPWPTPARRQTSYVQDYPPPKDDNGKVIIWAEWSPCSVSCGAGWRSRARDCDDCNLDFNDYENVQSQPCMVNFYCPVDGNWGPWFPWQSCSTSCAGGTKRRERTCNYPPPAYGGTWCQGNATAFKDCQNKHCPQNGQWSAWTTFSPCSKSCGEGFTTKRRRCDSPSPSHGGSDCPGKDEIIKRCEMTRCPVNGGWSMWSSWTICSASCGRGLKQRSRSCDSPLPAFGGHRCQGQDSDVVDCYSGRPCPVDGQWTTWTNYGYCRGPRCGRGYQIRSRRCLNPPPSNGGKHCHGQRYERLACINSRHCPRDGSWCPWSPWNHCSATCQEDTPVQGRQRDCNCPSPASGGRHCQGQSFQIQPCRNVNKCRLEYTTTTVQYTPETTSTFPVTSLSSGQGETQPTSSTARPRTDPVDKQDKRGNPEVEDLGQ